MMVFVKHVLKLSKIISTIIWLVIYWFNGNCRKKYTGRSHKLHKQAVTTTIICTEERIPLTYQTDAATYHDSKLGFNTSMICFECLTQILHL